MMAPILAKTIARISAVTTRDALAKRSSEISSEKPGCPDTTS